MTSTNVQTPTAYLTPRAAADYLAISASMLAKLRVCGDGPNVQQNRSHRPLCAPGSQFLDGGAVAMRDVECPP